jgi:alpha-beta hydrolase superfamily lysophospholipase
MNISRLVGLWVYVLRNRGVALVRATSGCLPVLEELQASLDVYVRRVKIGRTLVCVEGVGSLVVARLVL